MNIFAVLYVGLDQAGMKTTFLFAIFGLSVNLIQIARLLYVKISTDLPLEYSGLYNTLFKGFTVREFLLIIEKGSRKTITNDCIIKVNSQTDLFITLSGKADVLVDNIKVAEILPNTIIGEISFISEAMTMADVKANDVVEVISLSKNDLHKLESKYPDVYVKFYNMLIRCISEKLSKQNHHV